MNVAPGIAPGALKYTFRLLLQKGRTTKVTENDGTAAILVVYRLDTPHITGIGLRLKIYCSLTESA